jgi:hypothetical protein
MSNNYSNNYSNNNSTKMIKKTSLKNTNYYEEALKICD